MKDNLPLIISIVVSVIIGCFASSNRIGFVGGIDKVQKEAVLKGHAEWVADQSGKPAFKWKECK
jgi:hypothetical protein